MNEMLPWSEPGSDASRDEREILASAPDVGPPEGAQERVWSALALAIGSAAVATSAASTGVSAAKAASAGAHAGVRMASHAVTVKATSASLAKPAIVAVLKAFVLGSVGGAVAVGSGVWGSHVTPPITENAVASHPLRASGQTPKAVMQPSETSQLGAAAEAPSRYDAVHDNPEATHYGADSPPGADSASASSTHAWLPAPPASTRKPASSPRDRESKTTLLQAHDSATRLEAEARMVRAARTRLQLGDLPGATAYLEAAQSEFGQGTLVQEREALAIEILWKSGQAEAADLRARAFLGAFPDSPHGVRVRRALR